MMLVWRRRWYAAAYMMSGLRGSTSKSVTPVFSLMVSDAFQVAPPSVDLYRPRSPPGEKSGPCDATQMVLELRGSIQILAMCSELGRPMLRQVRPASVDL